MIKIVIMRQYDDKIEGFSIKGHAGAGAYGEDIVCSAVSALAQSVILSLVQHLHSNIDYDVQSGCLKLQLQDSPSDLTEAVFSVAILGFAEIEKKYSKFVTISNKQGVN